MLLGSLLKMFSREDEKRTLIREVIYKLWLEPSQEQLYLDSLEVLDDEHLDIFYKKLTALVEILEEKDIISAQEQQTSKIQSIRRREQEEKNIESFNILLDNV